MELDYCVEHGIPHSQFLGWPEDDQDKVVEYRLHMMGQCRQCGTWPAEWVEEDGTALEPPPYLAATQRCLGCATLEEAREQIPKDDRFRIQTYLMRNVKGRLPEWQRKLSQ